MTVRIHSKAYLEALLHPPISSGTIGSRPTNLTRTTSGVGLSTIETNNYKPAKSSGLAVEGGRAGESSDLAKNEESESFDERDTEYQSTVARAVFLDSASEDDDYDPSMFLRIHTTPSRSSQTSNSASQSVQVLLNLLDDDTLDDEERIERVRFTLAARLSELEGAPVSAVRLDNIVLSLLHRHREDTRPTGSTFTLPASPSPSPFPASPRSRPRPASLRSMSGTNAVLSRPWTPNLPMTPTGGTFSQDNGNSVPSSPLLVPQGINIGNGSPRASPSLWHRSISNSTSITATANPWSNSSPTSAPSSFFAPLGPPGDTIGSPPKSLTSHTNSSMLGTSVATYSRPSSPGNVAADSPRLNVAAVEFKPRTPSQSVSQQQATPQKSAPWLAEETKPEEMKAAEDSDEDEFSPFASQGAGVVPFPGSSSSSASSSRLTTSRTRPISGASGDSSIQSLTTAESNSGSYHGSTTSASLESSDDQRASKWASISVNSRGGPSKAGVSSTTSPTPIIDRASSSLAASAIASQQSQQQGGAAGPGRVCRYFLAGECRRADCRFSHDLNRAICRFWVKGQCLNGEGCSFLHDTSIMDKLTTRVRTLSTQGGGSSNTSRSGLETPPNEEFPELRMAPTGPKAQRNKGPGGSGLMPGSTMKD